MQSFLTMLQLQLMLFLIVLLGVWASKRGLLTVEGRKSLTDLLVYLMLPCSIILSFQIDVTPGLFVTMGAVLVASVAAQLLAFLYSKAMFRCQPSGRRAVLQYGVLCSNSGFLGLPIVQGLFGTQGMLYASLALIPLRVLMWSAGLSLYTVTSPKTMMRNLLTHPCIVAVYIGFGVMLSPWPLPAVAQGTLNALGSCTTAVSMLVIGSILSEVRLRSLFDRSAFIYSAVRLLFIPVTVLLLLRLLGFDPLIANTVTLLSAMPAASTTAILASKCGGDAPFAAQIVCVSTALSVITLPLICLLF